ncbi:putative ADP-ribosylation factor GTPase-activating protein AGD6 [Sesamum alatum]|uniref:ADP-ribosylation factor GTPase-activating protein AGD6 n=1 Tax=Sesamum alatum TaxID=300844 RepID=A0AAE1XW61_9LAMI|nr:putative ADP-ribosylation factor GTPase-activating protein AGD6 [Sesamum alatum]
MSPDRRGFCPLKVRSMLDLDRVQHRPPGKIPRGMSFLLFLRLSMVDASAASVVQAGTKELTSRVKEGGYDHKVNETVNVVTAKTSEIGQKTWGLMKGVMALATQKVEEYTKEGSGWTNDDWQRKERQQVSSNSWDDWDIKDNRKQEPSKGTTAQDVDSWAGWDDGKDDGYDNSYHNHSASDRKTSSINGKSDAKWTEGGFL